jgi:hypothetical protein
VAEIRAMSEIRAITVPIINSFPCFVKVPRDITPQKLLLVLKAFFSDEEDKNRPYLFFVNDQEIKGELHVYLAHIRYRYCSVTLPYLVDRCGRKPSTVSLYRLERTISVCHFEIYQIL